MLRLIKDIADDYGEEKALFCANIARVLRSKVIARNLYGWKHYIDDLLSETIYRVVIDNFKRSGGNYVAWGIQSAIDKSRYYSAKKRKAEFDSFQPVTEDFDSKAYIESIPDDNTQQQADKLVLDISMKWGNELATELEPFLRGFESQLSKEVLKKINTSEFKSWYITYLEGGNANANK